MKLNFWNHRMPKFSARNISREAGDATNVQDGSVRRKGSGRVISEPLLVPSGRVTVIKNYGRRDEEYACKNKKNLLTTEGRDELHKAYTNSSGTGAFRYIGTSTSTADPTASTTQATYASQITTNGLARAEAGSIDHTAGNSLTTLSKQFTATGGSHSNIHSAGLFNASTGGQLIHAAAFDNDVTLQENDTLTVEWQITLG